MRGFYHRAKRVVHQQRFAASDNVDIREIVKKPSDGETIRVKIRGFLGECAEKKSGNVIMVDITHEDSRLFTS